MTDKQTADLRGRIAEALRGAADAVAALKDKTDVNVAEYQRYDFRQRCALGDAESLLRRMADEAQQQPEARPGCPDPIECNHEAALGEARQQARRLGLMVDEYGAGASALTDKLKRAQDMHRETCPWAQGKAPSPAFRCGMCDVLDAPAMPVQQPAAADIGEEADVIRLDEDGRDVETGHEPGCASQSYPDPGICYCEEADRG